MTKATIILALLLVTVSAFADEEIVTVIGLGFGEASAEVKGTPKDTINNSQSSVNFENQFLDIEAVMIGDLWYGKFTFRPLGVLTIGGKINKSDNWRVVTAYPNLVEDSLIILLPRVEFGGVTRLVGDNSFALGLTLGGGMGETSLNDMSGAPVSMVWDAIDFYGAAGLVLYGKIDTFAFALMPRFLLGVNLNFKDSTPYGGGTIGVDMPLIFGIDKVFGFGGDVGLINRTINNGDFSYNLNSFYLHFFIGIGLGKNN